MLNLLIDCLTTAGSSSVTIPTFSNAPPSGGLPLPISSSQVKLPAITAGLPPYPQDIPAKLVKKILNLEYIEMAELLSSHWTQGEPESHCCGGHVSHSTKRGPVTDILVWLDCYASLVAILCSSYPEKIGHFMIYQKTIIKAQRTYVGEGWLIYDSCFRRRAANTKSPDWGYKDNDLYGETFTGRARGIPRCRFCLSKLHSLEECTQGNQTPERLPSNTEKRQGYALQTPQNNVAQVCQLYNATRGQETSHC